MAMHAFVEKRFIGDSLYYFRETVWRAGERVVVQVSVSRNGVEFKTQSMNVHQSDEVVTLSRMVDELVTQIEVFDKMGV
ncbi:MAG: hypothetical protein QM805_07810 [Pseudomonas sp.]